jgi:vacuolar-type H+-ATPase catalytic subunit A/Vma1
MCSLDDLEAEDEDTAKEVEELHSILEQFPKDCSEYAEAVDMVEDVEKTEHEWDDKKKVYRDKLMENLEKQQELERLEKDMVKEADQIDEHLDHVELLLGKSNGDDPFGTAEASASTTEAREELEKVKNQVKDFKEKQNHLLSEGKDEEVNRHPAQPIDERVAYLESLLKDKEDQ